MKTAISPSPKRPATPVPWLAWFAVILLAAGFAVVQALIGGARYVFLIPGLFFLAAASALAALHSPTLRKISLPAFASTLVFAGYLIWRSVVSPHTYLAWFHLMLVPACLLVYLLAACKLTSPRYRLAVLGALLALGAIHSIIALYQFVKEPNWMPFGFLRPDYGVRGSGMLVCPNHLAGLLELCFFAGLTLVFWGRIRPAWRILAAYATALCAVGIMVSISRGGYLSTLCGLTVFAIISLWVLFRTHPTRFVPALLIAIALFAAGTWLVRDTIAKSWQIEERVDQLINMENMRFLLWDSAREQAATSPVLGTGAGSFLVEGRRLRDTRVQHDPIHVHNDYLHLLAEFGWIGMVLWGLCWITHTWNGTRQILAVARERMLSKGRVLSSSMALQFGALCGLAAITAHSVVDFNMHVPAVALVMCWQLGILASREGDGNGRSTPRAMNWLAVLLLLGGAGWLTYAGIKLYPQERVVEEMRVQLREKNYDAVLKISTRLDRETVTNPYYFKYRGDAFVHEAEVFGGGALRRSFTAQGAAEYSRAVALFPDDSFLVMALGSALDYSSQHNAAAKVWAKGLELDPNLAIMRTHYAFHLHLTGQLVAAQAEYQRAGELGANSEMARTGPRLIKEHLDSLPPTLP